MDFEYCFFLLMDQGKRLIRKTKHRDQENYEFKNPKLADIIVFCSIKMLFIFCFQLISVVTLSFNHFM